MRVKEVNIEIGIVTFQKDEMEFCIRFGKLTSWYGRRPTPSEFNKAIKHFYGIL
jgi:hypothetical protein